MNVTVAVEGPSDGAVLGAVLRTAGFQIQHTYVKGGKSQLDRSLRAYNNAARFGPWLVLRDLDHDADCAPDLTIRLLPTPAPHMCFRIAVRSVEAWLLADVDAFAQFFGVNRSRIPPDPDCLPHPKRAVIDLAVHSRKREIRADVAPRPGSGAREGAAYSSRVSEFALTSWRPKVAALKSDSLARCLRAIRRLADARPASSTRPR